MRSAIPSPRSRTCAPLIANTSRSDSNSIASKPIPHCHARCSRPTTSPVRQRRRTKPSTSPDASAAKSANPEWRARFVSSRYSPYEARIAADFAGGGGDAVWKAFRTSEQVRARSLADQLADGPRRTPSDAQTEDLRTKLTSLQLRLESRAQKQDADDAGTVELRRSIAETGAQLDAARAAVAAGELALPESLEKVQGALPRDVAVLAYFVGDLESHAWLLTRKGLKHKSLPGIERLQKEVAAAIAMRGSMAGSARGRDLGLVLFGGLLDEVDENRVLIIPDGPLNGVPFAALPAGRSTAQLIDRFVLSYAPSLTLALNSPRRAASHQRVAVVSDPVYAPDDRRLQIAMGANGGTLRGPPEASPNKLTRLPYSGLEARAVLEALGDRQAITLVRLRCHARSRLLTALQGPFGAALRHARAGATGFTRTVGSLPQ